MSDQKKIKNTIFILGCQRSGTTLVANLLRYSSYGRPSETFFIIKYFKKLNKYGDIKNIKNFKRLMNDILNERAVMQWKLSIDIDKFYNDLDEFSFREIVNKICMAGAEKKGYKFWGDKTPHYILNLDIIYHLFPESKYIYIVRDGRDVALSLLGREWEPFNIFSCAEQWKEYNAQRDILDQLERQKQLFFLRYENLLDNAERIIPEIYEFLGEEYDESKMKDLVGRIRKSNFNKWKRKMTARQIKIFELTAANTLKRFGYETSHDETGVNGITSTLYKLHEAFMKAKFLFKINVIDGIKIKFFGKQPFAE